MHWASTLPLSYTPILHVVIFYYLYKKYVVFTISCGQSLLMLPSVYQETAIWGWGWSSVAECLPSMHEALGLIPSTIHTKGEWLSIYMDILWLSIYISKWEICQLLQSCLTAFLTFYYLLFLASDSLIILTFIFKILKCIMSIDHIPPPPPTSNLSLTGPILHSCYYYF
jgi:hypothetical protein